MDKHIVRQFLRYYVQPSLGSIQIYLWLFLGISLLSFATYLRDFVSVPLLFVQLFSPILAPIILYALPSSMVSALLVGRWADQHEINDMTDTSQLGSRLNWVNIGLALLLTLFYIGIVINFTEIGSLVSLNELGIYVAFASIPAFLLGSALGGYARMTAYRAMKPAKGKRKLKHDLQDSVNDTDELLIVETESAIEDQLTE